MGYKAVGYSVGNQPSGSDFQDFLNSLTDIEPKFKSLFETEWEKEANKLTSSGEPRINYEVWGMAKYTEDQPPEPDYDNDLFE